MKKVLKPFDLEKAKNGAKLSTRQGECIQWWHKLYDGTIIYGINEDFRTTDINGTCHSYRSGSNYDLMIEEVEFENGDILAKSHGKDLCVIILREINKLKCNEFSYYAKLYYDGSVDLDWQCSGDDYRLATEEEKQKLFNALAAIGKRWNTEKKAIEDVKEENKCEFKRGQAVLVRDNHDSFWKLALFIDYNRNTAYSYLTTSGGKKLCIDYDSHRDLLYQFDNPE